MWTRLSSGDASSMMASETALFVSSKRLSSRVSVSWLLGEGGINRMVDLMAEADVANRLITTPDG
uniref:Uncharacterized protein n=1 Tax=Lepeophtheirus salmonis TaxID=72036 RepID=A0A0K2V0W3_LEPSM